jgi:hypothetical protein
MAEFENDDDSGLLELEEQLKTRRRRLLLIVGAVAVVCVVGFLALGGVMRGENENTEMATRIGGIRGDYGRVIACLLRDAVSAQNWGEEILDRLTEDPSSRGGVLFCLGSKSLDWSFTAEERERYASVEQLESALAGVRQLREVLRDQPAEPRDEARSICLALVALAEGFAAIEQELNVSGASTREIDCGDS